MAARAFIDFRERAPRAASRNMYLDAAGKVTQDSIIGYRASGVPGTVRGLEYAAQKFGTKPWAELVRPAVELASKGFAALLRPGAIACAARPRTRAAFPNRSASSCADGKYYEPGETFVQPDLARTLERIAAPGRRRFLRRRDGRACWPRT